MFSNMTFKFVTMTIFILASVVHRSFARSGVCYLRKSQSPMGYRVATPTVPLSASIPNQCSTACSNSTTLLDSCFDPTCLCLNPNGRDLQTCINCLYNLSSSTTLGDNYNMVQAAFDEFADACFGYPVAPLSLVNQTTPTSSSSSVFPSGTFNATSTSVQASGTSNGTSISASSNSTSSTTFSTTTALNSTTRSTSSTSSTTSSTYSYVGVTATGRPANIRSVKQRCRLKK